MENYAQKMTLILEGASNAPSVLLHSCCGPCSTSVLASLVPKARVTVFFYNPNVTDKAEYDLRLSAQRQVATSQDFAEKVKLIEGEYDPENFLAASRGMEGEKEGGARCERCFYLRLKRTALLAKAHGYDYFTTTLTVSPHKNAELINRIGQAVASEVGVPFLPSDFKKKDGYLTSIRLSKKLNLYRQGYCGCEFSKPSLT